MSKSKIKRDNRGRKSLPEGEKRSEWCGFAVKPVEKEKVRKDADRAGFAAESAYLRNLAGLPTD